MKSVTLKGIKYPVFNTPLTHADIIEIREKYDKYVIFEVGKCKMVPYSNNSEYHRYRIDLGFRSMVNILLCLVGSYYAYTLKNKVQKKMKNFNPLSTSQETKDFINSLGKDAKNGTSKPIHL